MKAFKNAHFQVLPECTFFNSGFYSTKWSSVKVSEKTRGLKYIIHVSRKLNGKEVAYDIPVKPVYEGKSYDSAMTAFSGAFKQYENVYAAEDKKRQDAQKQLVVYREKHKNATVYSAANNSGIITVVKTENNMWANLSGDEKITRAFAADRFGVWNCDKPLPYKRKDYVEVTARDVTGHGIKEGMLYVGDVKNRAIFKYDEKERNKVGMEKEGKYIVWIIDSDEQLHFTKVDLTGKELPETKKLMLDMSISPQIPSNPLQLKKLMGI